MWRQDRKILSPEESRDSTFQLFRNREKGVLAKGVSAGSSVTPKETENTQRYWAQQYIGHWERHSQERRTFLQKPPSKNPLFSVPEVCAELRTLRPPCSANRGLPLPWAQAWRDQIEIPKSQKETDSGGIQEIGYCTRQSGSHSSLVWVLHPHRNNYNR